MVEVLLETLCDCTQNNYWWYTEFVTSHTVVLQLKSFKTPALSDI
jgi:hypothetical protein